MSRVAELPPKAWESFWSFALAVRAGRISGLRTEKHKSRGQGILAKQSFSITMIKDIVTKLKEPTVIEQVFSELVSDDGDFGVVKNYGKKGIQLWVAKSSSDTIILYVGMVEQVVEEKSMNISGEENKLNGGKSNAQATEVRVFRDLKLSWFWDHLKDYVLG